MLDLYREILDLCTNHTPFVRVTVTEKKGSIPQEVGASMLVTTASPKLPHHGTIGGGALEFQAIQKSLALLKTHGKSTSVTWNLNDDLEMSCSGKSTLFFEPYHQADKSIAIFGAGHVCQHLIPVLKSLHYQLFCIDSREEWLQKCKEQGAETIHASPIEIAVKKLPPVSHILVMTHGHLHDFAVVKEIFKLKNLPQYLGVIGSKSKAQELKMKLKKGKIPEDRLDLITSPVGLRIGNNTPPEIAISIAAQLIGEKRTTSALKIRA